MRSSKSAFILGTLSLLCLASPLYSTALTVSTPGDANVGGGGTFAGTTGDLRGVLNYINSNPGTYTVTFSSITPTITLQAPLPILNLNSATNSLAMDGTNGGSQIIINGGGLYRGFIAEQGVISLSNFTIENVVANGGSGAGGGGLGAGAGLFVDNAVVAISNLTINGATATGGHGGTGGGGGGLGGAGSPGSGGGGGGGIGGVGGNGTGSDGGGGGGINAGTNFTGAGGTAPNAGATGGGIGGASAGAGGGGGGAGGATGGGGGGGSTGGTNSGGGGGLAGSAGSGTNGGAGGYGGGGGGSNNGLGGLGGFGGGGGFGITTGGGGGFGGGGGSGGTTGGLGGFGGGGGGGGTTGGLGGVGGGSGASGSGNSGGGAGLGGGIFVNKRGSLTISGPFTTGSNSVTAGAAGGAGASAGSASGNDMFILSNPLLTLSPNGSSITINNSIGDDSTSSLANGTGYGASLTIGSMPGETGIVTLNAASTYAGGTLLRAGTLAVTNAAALGTGALTFTSAHYYAYVSNSNSPTISVIDTATNTVVATITVGSEPFVAGAGSVASGGYELWVPLDGTSPSSVAVVNLRTYSVATTLTTGGGALQAVFTPNDELVFVSCDADDDVYVYTTGTPPMLSTITGSHANPIGLAATPDGTRVYSANENFTCKVYSTTFPYSTIQIISVGDHPYACAITPDGKLCYYTDSSSFGVGVVDTDPTSPNYNTPIANIPLTNPTFFDAVTPNGNYVYVPSTGGTCVYVINTATNTVTATIPISPGGAPYGLGITPDGKFAYVSNYTGSNTVSVINTATNTVVATVTVGAEPSGVTTSFDLTTTNTFQAGVNNLNITNPIHVYSNGIIDPQAFTFTLSGFIDGGGTLTKISSGTAVFSNANTYSGGTFIDQGILVIETDTSVGTGTVTFAVNNGGILQANAANLTVANPFTFSTNGTIDTLANTLTLSGNMNGTGGLTKVSSGTLILSGTNTYSGGTTINSASTVQINTVASLPTGGNVNTAVSGANLFLNTTSGAYTIGDLTGVAGSTFMIGNNAVTFGTSTVGALYAGNITGTGGSMNYQGTGSAIFSGTNTYTAGTTVSAAGTLFINSTASLPTGGNVTTSASGATLNLSNVSSSTFTIGDLSGVAGSAVNLGSNSLIFGTSTASVTYAGNITGTTSSLTKQGSGTAIFSGTNTYSGSTTITNGTLQINTPASLPSSTNLSIPTSGAELNISTSSGGVTIGNLSGVTGSLINLGANSLTFGTATNETFGGNISGVGGSLIKQGSSTEILSGNSTYTGGTSLNLGTISVGSNTAIGTGTLTFMTNGTILQSDAAGLNLANAITLTANGTVDSQANIFTLSGNITGAGALTKIGSGTLILSGMNSWAGLTTISNGILQINTVASLPASTNVSIPTSGAELNISTAGGGVTIGDLSGVTGSLINLGANSLTFGTANNETFGGNISGVGGSLIKQGAGTQILSGNSTYTGGTTLNLGTLSVGSNTALGTGTLTFATSGTILQSNAAGLNLANPIALTANGTVDSQANTFTLSGNITGASNLTKQGSGTLILSGTNTYGGSTTINAGILSINTPASIPSTSNVNIPTSGAELDISPSSGNVTIGDLTGVAGSLVNLGSNSLTFGGPTPPTTTFAGNIMGSGGITKQNATTAVLTGTNTYTGGTTVTFGTLTINATSALPTGTNVTLSSGTTLNLSNAGPFTIGSLTGAATSVVNIGAQTLTFGSAATATFAGNITGTTAGITKAGSGIEILSGMNLYSGTTTISNGILQISSTSALPTGTAVNITASGAELNISTAGGGVTIGDLSGVSGSLINLGANSLTFGTANSETFAGSISGIAGGMLIKQGSGTETLSGSSSYSGGTTLNLGTLAIGTNTSLGTGNLVFATNGTTLQAAANNLNVANTMSLTANGIIDTQGNTLTLSNSINGGGTLTKQGSGLLDLTGASTYTGATTVTAGTLAVNGSITSNVTVDAGATLHGTGTINGTVDVFGTISPGNSIGTLFTGSTTLEASSIYINELNPTVSDLLDITGTLTIVPGATFVVEPTVGTYSSTPVLVISTTGGVTGTFTNFTEPMFFNARLIYTADDVFLGITVAPLSTIVGCGQNTMAVANAIDTINTNTGTIGPIFASLLNLTSMSQVCSALDQLQPALFAGNAITQQSNAVQVENALSHRLQNILDNAYCVRECFEESTTMWGGKVLEQVDCRSDKRLMHVWVDGFEDFLNQKNNFFKNSPQVGYKAQTGGVVSGIDFNFIDYLYVGALGAYTNSDIRWHGHRGKGHIHSGYAGLYASGISKMYYGNASVIRSWNHFDSKRNIVFPGVNKRAHNTHTGNQVLTHLDTGINWGQWGFVIRPFDSFDYITQQESRYKEKGAGPFDLVVRGKTLKMIRNELGVSFGRCFVSDNGQITGDVKFSWVREHRLKGKDTTSAFTGTDVHFTVVSNYHSRNLFSPGVSISYKYNLFDLTAYYDGEFTHKYRDQAIGLQARFDF